MKIVPLIALLLISLILIVAGAAADTILVQNVQVNTIGGITPVNIVLDTTPGGIAGYDLNVSLSNSSVATITAVSSPPWAILNESTPLPASFVRLRMVDLYEQVNSGTTNVSFGTITLQGNAIGSTAVVVMIKNITSDNGESVTPAIQSGEFTVDTGAYSQPIIANHTSVHLSEVPLDAINNAKSNLHIAYGHTSHGSQIIDGMDGLTTFAGAPYGSTTYAWNNGGTSGALDLRDNLGNYNNEQWGGAYDLGQPNFTAWPNSTRRYLQVHPDINVIMWSWCGQVSSLSDAQLNYYLYEMNKLESEYPNVHFVYMTGHLDGSGTTGTLYKNNQKIRAFAEANNKILYDFADIESYDPDGLVNYMELGANDNCEYTLNGVSHNWATEWQVSHAVNVDWYQCSPAHTQALNGNQKAYAAWWLWARLAGWDGESATITQDTIGLYSKSAGVFLLKNSNSGGSADRVFQYGWGGDDLVPLVGDWTGSGKDTIGLYSKSAGIFLLKNSNSGGSADSVFQYGWGGDDLVPLVGDWTGSGKDTVGLYQQSTGIFFLKNSNIGGVADNVFQYGWGGYELVPIIGL